jgi:hypothetical protein
MDREAEEVEARKVALIEDLENEARWRHHRGLRNYFYASGAFYASMLFGGLAVAAGVVKSLQIHSEVVSMLAAIGTGASFLAREAKYGAEADRNFAFRDSARQCAAKLRFELPFPNTLGSIIAISEEWRRQQVELAARKSALRELAASARSQPPHKSSILHVLEGTQPHQQPLRSPNSNL